MRKSALILLLSLSLLGCGTSLVKAFVDSPEVKGVELAAFSVKNKQAIFKIALYNPNAFSLPISGMTGDIVLNQMIIGSIDAESEQSLAAHSTQLVTLPIMLNVDDLVKAAKSVLNRGEAEYTFNGSVMTSVGQIPFSKEGNLSIQDLISAFFR
ncbi:MAG: LEA type 2 family protein [Methylococcaceae bacterium]|nr:LEA type 2 family protein [Methylococcaceae bacterium]